MSPERLSAVADWLEESAAGVRRIEERARVVIEEQGDQQGYEALMREKALFLAGLADEAGERFKGVAGMEAVARRIDRFSASATNALEIGSVFYMSALLYPEDHVAGEPNDLDVLAATLRETAGTGQ